MTTGQFPNEGRFVRRQSPAGGFRTQARIRPLEPSTLGDEQYGGQAQTANQLALDYFWGAAAPAGVTGTIVETEANDTSTASGTITVTGTIVETEAADTSAASGAITVTGSLAEVEAADTPTASATVTATGTLAETESADTSAADGTITVTGTAAVTEAVDVGAASGTITITGTLAASELADTSTAAGDVGGGPVDGAIAATEANDTANATGVTEQAASSGGGGSRRPPIFTRGPKVEPPSPPARLRPRPLAQSMSVGVAPAIDADDVCHAVGVVSTDFDAELEQLLLVGAL